MSKTEIKKPITKGAAKVPVVMQLEALECGAASRRFRSYLSGSTRYTPKR